MTLLEAFKKNIAQKGLVAEGQKVLLATSGGVDSMVMAQLFYEAKMDFAVAHCNFSLRGDEADMDEQLVNDAARKWMVPFYSTRFETKKLSEEWGKSIQETARILRYEWLEKIREDNKLQYIATAHHADDNVETLLMHLMKGTGISGLHGIPERNGVIIRPLLFSNKEEIKEYAQVHGVPYREDASNAKHDYLRNAIRHKLVPVMKELVPGAVQHMNSSIGRFADAEVLYKKAIEAERKKLMEQRGKDFYLSLLKLKKREPLATVCYELFQPYGFLPAQVPQILELLDAETGKYVTSATHRIIRNRDFLVLTTLQATGTDMIGIEGVPCTIEAEGQHFTITEQAVPLLIPTDKDVACIDMSKLSFPLVLRKWRKGDYFYPLGMGMKKKKLSNFFIDQKVPLHEKENVWVLESDKRIVWVAGMRPDERFKVKNGTERVLLVKRKLA